MAMLVLSNDSTLTGREAGVFRARRGVVSRHEARVRDDWELILVRRGVLPISEAGTDLTTAAGQVLLLRPGERHVGHADYPRDLEFAWIHFALRGGRQRDGIALPQRLTPARPARVAVLAQQYLADWADGVRDARLLAAQVRLLLIELAQPRAPRAVPMLAARAEAWIAAHFHEPIGTAGVARALRVNADHLGQVFRTAFGQGIVERIQRLRVDDACRLIKSGEGSLGAIARAVGFGDHRYLRRLFVRFQGCTPSDYARVHGRAVIVGR